jgi:Flp pilus assembly protein TadG
LKRCAGLRDDNGSALVEVALFLSLVGVPMLLGTADLGWVVYDSSEIANAAHAGAMYGMQSLTYAENNSGITTAARAEAADFGTNLSVSPTTYYACSLAVNGTKYTGTNAETNATAGCTGSENHPLEFVQVVTSATITPNIHWPGLPATFTLSATSVMEVEQ